MEMGREEGGRFIEVESMVDHEGRRKIESKWMKEKRKKTLMMGLHGVGTEGNKEES